MSLKCSIFGHDFGDPETEQEREEQGNEVVTTTRKVETCTRCGETRVISENKEVTSLETPSDIVGDELDDQADEKPDTTADVVDTSTDDHQSEPPGHAPAESPAGDEAVDVDGEDAVILEDEEDDEDVPERSPGEWPDESEREAEPPRATTSGSSEGETAAPSAGEWPEEDDAHTEMDWRPDIEPATEEPEVEATDEAITVPKGEFYCPECGFTTAVEASSLREGDFCPECHRGTLSHRLPED